MFQRAWSSRSRRWSPSLPRRTRVRSIEALEPRLALDSTMVFNEVFYNPADGNDSLEWIEFYNQTAVDIDLSGWSLGDGVQFDFTSGTTIAGDGFLVVAKDPAAFEAATGISGALGPFGGQLSNRGETLQLLNNSGRVMDTLEYQDRELWPTGPDGSGATLAKKNERLGSRHAASWTASGAVGGTPKERNFPMPWSASTVTLNEVAGGQDASFFIEIVNTGSGPVDVSGYVLASTSATTPYVLPVQSAIPAAGHLSVSETALGFRGSADDRIFLFEPDQTTLVDAARVNDRLRGRLPEGSGPWLFADSPTPGAANRFNLHDEIVINEIMYHNRLELAAPLPGDSSDAQWIELYNRGNTAVDLGDWQIEDAVDFDFPPGTSMAPGEYLVVANDAASLAAEFPPIAGQIVGDFSRVLANGNDRIVLLDDAGNPADEVHYYDNGRWPWRADGGGSSLELTDPDADNARAEAWKPSRESDRSAWQTYTYVGTAAEPPGSNNPAEFDEFILGLLDAGGMLLDDLHVIEDPDGLAIERLQNGSFESDAVGVTPDAWRIIGNHESRVIVDPTDPGNKVLRLKATGATEHMHNHAETTFANGARIAKGAKYEISFRAKWLWGSNQLNTRLYFNQLARTTIVELPPLHGTPGAANTTLQTNIGPTYDQFQHAPVVPKASEPVVVSALADDPDTVETMKVWYSVNGGAWSAVGMSDQGGGTYAGTIPGQSAAAVVQFYVAGTDALGAASTFPAAGANSRALYVVDDGRAGSGPNHNFRIIMTRDDNRLQTRETNVMSNQRLGATVLFGEEDVYYDVGVRLKGSGFSRAGGARGYNIRFHPDQLYQGVHDVVAVDRNGGPYGIGASHREMVLKHIANRAGGVYGMYDDLIYFVSPDGSWSGPAQLLMARFDDEFLDSSFDNGSDGTRFKLELIYYSTLTDDGTPEGLKRPPAASRPGVFPVLGVDIQDMGNDKEGYRQNLLIKNNRARDDYARIVELGQTLSVTGGSVGGELDLRSQAVMDVDQWLRNFAFESLAGINDTYNQGLPHNFQLFVRPEDQRVVALPWDQDFAFHQSATFNIFGTGSHFRKVIDIPSNKRLFYGHLLDIINSTYNTEYLTPWIEYYVDFAANDHTSSLISYINTRRNYVLGQLPADVPFAITTNGGNDFSIDEPSVTLSGDGWIDVREIRLAGSAEPLSVEWTDLDSWQVTLPLFAGANPLMFEATNYQGDLVGTDSIVVTSSVGDTLHEFLRITEMNYHPYDPLPAYGDLDVDSDQFEFIELANRSDNETIDLKGVSLTKGITFTFGDQALAPGDRILVVHDQAAFESRYGTSHHVAGQFVSGKLSNSGETVRLEDANGNLLIEFTYDDSKPWPGRADGKGASLEVRDTESDYDDAENWRSSSEYGGSPGTAGTGPQIDVVVNEVLAATGADEMDQVELVNTTANQVDLSRWYMSNDDGDLLKSSLAPGMKLSSQANLVLDALDLGFTLSGDQGDELWLVAADTTTGKPLRFADHVQFDATDLNQSVGRWPDGDPSADVFPMRSLTLGGPNSGPVIGPVTLSEVQYHPWLPSFAQDFNGGAGDGLTPITGTWSVSDDRYEVTPVGTDDTISLVTEPIQLGAHFEIGATVRTVSGTGFNNNAAILFDFVSPTDFKFMSLHSGVGKWRLGRRDEFGWNFLAELSETVPADVDHAVTLEIDGSTATLRGNAVTKLVYNFGEPLGVGLVGLGSKNGSAMFDDVTVTPLNADDFEFVELFNNRAIPVDLTEWEVDGGIDIVFLPGTTIEAASTLVILPFDPVVNVARVEAFRTHYAIDETVALAGPYSGNLNDRGDTVRLLRPLDAGATGWVLVDRVAYDDQSPWPPKADGQGASLTRVVPQAYGDSSSSWQAEVPSPGSATPIELGDMDLDRNVDFDDIDSFVRCLNNAVDYIESFGAQPWYAGDTDRDGDLDFDDVGGFVAIFAAGWSVATSRGSDVETQALADAVRSVDRVMLTLGRGSPLVHVAGQPIGPRGNEAVRDSRRSVRHVERAVRRLAAHRVRAKRTDAQWVTADRDFVIVQPDLTLLLLRRE